MIPKIATGLLFALLLFYNPLRIEDKKVCTNIPYVTIQFIGYSSNTITENIKMSELGD